MKNYISFFEIPTTDFDRAKKFYQSILNVRIEEVEMDGTLMGLLPNNGKNVSGAIIKGDGYIPSTEGVIIYLNGGDNLQITLDKIEPSGGKIILQKTHIGPEMGFYAMFIDTEGNKLALLSTN